MFEPQSVAPDDAPMRSAPLAARMRPRTFDEYVGQEHLVGEGKIAAPRSSRAGSLPSIILWGPPGTGKTTLARIIAAQHRRGVRARLAPCPPGVADLRKAVAEARERLRAGGGRTVLFIDEIHRFNKAQQDAILPYVEDGTVTLIGATTENPSFEVIGPLLSRSRVFALKQLEPRTSSASCAARCADARARPRRRAASTSTTRRSRRWRASVGGDARIALNALEAAVVAATARDGRAARHRRRRSRRRCSTGRTSTTGRATRTTTRSRAFIKSLRGSDPDAALYWLARMIEAGEDPLFIVRRMVILASEDVGLADPQAMVVAIAVPAGGALHRHAGGLLPAGGERALPRAGAEEQQRRRGVRRRPRATCRSTRNDPVPLHLRNAVTGLMRQMGYGSGYKYAHDYDGGVVEQQHLPDRVAGHTLLPRPRSRLGGPPQARAGHRSQAGSRLTADHRPFRLRVARGGITP